MARQRNRELNGTTCASDHYIHFGDDDQFALHIVLSCSKIESS